jgi:hypothetical protein
VLTEETAKLPTENGIESQQKRGSEPIWLKEVSTV